MRRVAAGFVLGALVGGLAVWADNRLVWSETLSRLDKRSVRG